MAVSQTITDTLVQDFIIKAVNNVCSTMMRQEASFVEKTAEADRPAVLYQLTHGATYHRAEVLLDRTARVEFPQHLLLC